MPRGDKSSYSGKQKRQAEHIEKGYEKRGVGRKEAERRAWATVIARFASSTRRAGTARSARRRSARVSSARAASSADWFSATLATSVA